MNQISKKSMIKIFGRILRLHRKLIIYYLNTIYSCYNIIKLRSLGVVIGKRGKFPVRMNVWIAKNAQFIAGDNLHIAGSVYHTPLSQNTPTIKVEDSARLVIGNNVGMSSPSIWVFKSIKIGNNVNIGGGLF